MKSRQNTTSLKGPRISDRDEGLMEDTARTSSQSHAAVTTSPRRNIAQGKRTTRMVRKTSRDFNENKITLDTLLNNKISNHGTNAEEGEDHRALVTDAAKKTGIQDERKSTTYGRKIRELTKLKALVEGVIKDASTELILESKPKGDVTEIATLRTKLDRAEASIETGKLEHSMVMADLQGKLLEREKALHRLEEESLQKDIEREKSKEDENRLRKELRRAQEDVSFLSAWDEEKVELEAEVKSLKMKVSSAIEEGEERLEEARREFRIASVAKAFTAQTKLASDRREIRQDLERELSDEFRNRRRENEEFRREIEHQNEEMNCLMKELSRVKGALSTKRAELKDERRMHLLTIRGKKVAEALIVKLKTQLVGEKHSKICFPQRPGICSELDMTRQNRNASRNRIVAPRTGRSSCVVGPHPKDGSVRVDSGLSRVSYGGTGGSNSRNSRTACADLGNMVGLLAPACPEDASTLDDRETTAVAGGTEGANMPGARKDQQGSTSAAEGDGACSGKDITNDNFDNRTAGDKVPDINITFSVPAMSGSGNGRISRKDGEVFEMLPHDASEVTSVDVWSQLDSYIHRRSEVARTNRHIRVIEAIHKPPTNPSSRVTNAFESSSMSSTSGKLLDTESRVSRHGDCSTTANGECQGPFDWQERSFDNAAILKRVSGRVDEQSADGSCTRDHIRGDSSDLTGSALCNLGTLNEGTTAASGTHPECTEGEGTDREKFGTMARRPDNGGGELRGSIRTSVVQKPDESGSYPCIDLRESVLPSLTSNTCCATGITKHASRAPRGMVHLKVDSGAWRDKVITPMLPLDKPCVNGEGRGNRHPKGNRWRMGGANKGGGVGAKRRTCRMIELAEWIQANTNLVNVAFWENSSSSSPLDIPGATVVPGKPTLPYFPPITHQM